MQKWSIYDMSFIMIITIIGMLFFDAWYCEISYAVARKSHLSFLYKRAYSSVNIIVILKKSSR